MNKWQKRLNKREIETWYIDNFDAEKYKKKCIIGFVKTYLSDICLTNYYDIYRINIKPINISVLFWNEYELNDALDKYLYPIKIINNFLKTIKKLLRMRYYE